MIFLQAAIAYGMVLLAIAGISIFLGIPVFAVIAYGRLKNKEMLAGTSKAVIWLLAILVGIGVVALLLVLLWVFALSKVDLSYS
jgi:hypothetical protein